MQSRTGLSQSLLFQSMEKKAKPMFVLLSWEALLVRATCDSILLIRFLKILLTLIYWIGDIESMPFIEALRQLSFSVGKPVNPPPPLGFL